MTMTPLLQIEDLHVGFNVYGGKLRVLDGIDFVVHKGEKVGLVGETGCGKTTTMKAILRILPQPPAFIQSGEIRFHGQDLRHLKDKEMRNVRGQGISMIFQDPTAALNPVFTIGQQLEPVIKYASPENHKLPRKAIHQKAIQALKDVALADPERLLDAYPVQLSGGMRQRVCIGMALPSCSLPMNPAPPSMSPSRIRFCDCCTNWWSNVIALSFSSPTPWALSVR